MLKEKILILLTDGYPYDKSEVHLEKEVGFLFTTFSRIYIFSLHQSSELSYDLPENVTTFSVPINFTSIRKFRSIVYLFSGIFIRELYFMINTLKLFPTYRRIKYAITEISKAKQLEDNVLKYVINEIHSEKQVYIYSYWNNFKAVTAALIKKIYPKIKAFSRAHGWDVYFERMPGNYLPCKSILLKHLDAIYYVSEHGYNYSRNKFGNSAVLKISKLGTFQCSGYDFNVSNEIFHIVSCSSIIPLKRIDLIIHALSLIPDSYTIKWTHIGAGSIEGEIIDYANNILSSRNNIRFSFAGSLPNEEVLEFFRKGNVDIFINVSMSEGIPVTIMEAMSCGIPCIATSVGGTPEIVNEENGSLLPPDPDSGKIACKIQEYYELSKTDKLKKKEKAYQMWLENYNAEKNYIGFLKEII